MALQTSRTTQPLTLDEIDPAWLTGALRTRFPDVEVVDAVRDAERAGTSTSARFALTYADGTLDPSLPPAVYVKGGFDAVMRRRVWAAPIQEARFYADFADEVPLNLPGAYYAGVDDDARQGIVILEDLSARGVHLGHATDHVSVDALAACVTDLAALHARFWADARLAAYQNWSGPQRAYLRYLCRPKHWAEVLERPDADLLVQLLPTPEAALAGLEAMWAANDSRPPALLHGDCHGGNLFFEADGRPGFLDWQCTFPGNPGHDLGELMLTALDTEDRRRSERDLIEQYHDALLANGVPDAPGADELWLYYRRNIMHDMVSSVLNPYDMQSAEVTTITAGRTLRAAHDLDLLGALAGA
jgi:hypothetical protein